MELYQNNVVRPRRRVPRNLNRIIYFNNCYTNLVLMKCFAEEGIFCLATVQCNPLGKNSKQSAKNKVMKNNVPRTPNNCTRMKMWPQEKRSKFSGNTTHKISAYIRLVMKNKCLNVNCWVYIKCSKCSIYLCSKNASCFSLFNNSEFINVCVFFLSQLNAIYTYMSAIRGA